MLECRRRPFRQRAGGKSGLRLGVRGCRYYSACSPYMNTIETKPGPCRAAAAAGGSLFPCNRGGGLLSHRTGLGPLAALVAQDDFAPATSDGWPVAAGRPGRRRTRSSIPAT